jgi:HAD superfamily hydrolase (TIGR01548 family)
MDGVLAEVSQSYRAAILQTCHHYGARSVSQQVIEEWKIRGNSNCDWTLSHNLIRQDPNGDQSVTFDEVKETFERIYQGTPDQPGLCRLETLIPARETLQELKSLSANQRVGIVTGRPRSDCMAFLASHELLHDWVAAEGAIVCCEDGPNKPDPFPVLRCCELLGVKPSKRVVLVGDTPDDVKAALRAGCSAVGVLTPSDHSASTEGEEMEEAKKNDLPISLSPLALAMLEAGADRILRPGFGELVGMMKK